MKQGNFSALLTRESAARILGELQNRFPPGKPFNYGTFYHDKNYYGVEVTFVQAPALVEGGIAFSYQSETLVFPFLGDEKIKRGDMVVSFEFSPRGVRIETLKKVAFGEPARFVRVVHLLSPVKEE